MRLNIISESSRRDFLKQLSVSLVSGGLNIGSVGSVVQSVGRAVGKPLVYGIHADGAVDPRSSTVAENWARFQRKFLNFKRLVGDREIFLSPDGSDGVTFLVRVLPTDLPDLIEISGGIGEGFSIDDFDEEGSWIEFRNDTSISAVDGDMSFDAVLDPRALLKSWWDNWEKFGESFLDEKFAGFLSRNGVDVRRKFVDDGLNNGYVRENAIGQPHAEDWESEYTGLGDTVVPDDYRLASPMHQSFENKLVCALRLV